MSSPDYRAEAAQQPPAPRRSRWPQAIVALLAIGILALMAVLALQLSDPQQNVRPIAFEMRVADSAPAIGLTEASVRDDPKQTVYLNPTPLLTNADLESASVVDAHGQPAIEFATNRAAAVRLRHATATNPGMHLAILIDGEVWSAPRIRSEIGGKGVIMGNFSAVEAERIAAGIMQPPGRNADR